MKTVMTKGGQIEFIPGSDLDYLVLDHLCYLGAVSSDSSGYILLADRQTKKQTQLDQLTYGPFNAGSMSSNKKQEVDPSFGGCGCETCSSRRRIDG